MNKQTEALKMAIEALETCITYNPYEQGFNTELVETALESGKEVLKNLEKDPPISRNEQPAQGIELKWYQTEALRLAIEWIENAPFESDSWSAATRDITIQACKEALEHEEALDEMVRLAQEMGAYDAEQPAQGIELEWYQKGWDDAKQEGISKTETTTATIKESLNVEQPIATILSGGNLNDDCGYWVSKEDYAALDKLPTGTKLYTHPASQPAQEPVALDAIRKIMNKYGYQNRDMADEIIEAISHPAPSNGMDKPLFARVVPWQGLSLSEINDGRDKIENDEDIILDDAFVYGAQWAEQALRERNSNDTK